MEKIFVLNRITNLDPRSCITLVRSLQIVTAIYFTLSLICEIHGNNKVEIEANASVQKEGGWRLNWTEQSRQSTNLTTPPLSYDRETWGGHKERLTRKVWNSSSNHISKVAIYFDIQLLIQDNKYPLDKGASWIFQFTSHVWHYMTKTYGNFGTDPYLYLVVHHMKYPGAYLGYSVDPQNPPNQQYYGNLLDIGSSKPNAWLTAETRQEDKDLIVNNLAYFVEKSYKDHFGSPSFNVWKRDSYGHTAWVDIFTYDVYKSLNLTNEAESYEKKVIQNFETSSKNPTFWFRDWFLPIYNNQTGNSGGSRSSRVLRNYFQLIYDYVPKNTSKVYTHHFNLAEFVHFWSGAANVSLKQLAQNVFGPTSVPEVEFINARLKFSKVSKFYVYNENEAAIKQTTKPPTTTTQIITNHGRLNNTTPSTSGVTSKNGNDSRSNERTEKENSNKNTDNASQNNSSDGSLVIIVASVAGSIILLLIIVIGTTYIVQKKKIIYLKVDIRMLTNDEVDDFFEGNKNTNISSDEAQALILSMPFITAFEIPLDQMVLEYTKVLGSGQFGSVVQGQIRSRENDEMISVAMKTVKPNVDVDSFKAFLSEVKIMAYLGKHENIVELLGTCTAHIQNREIYIALEFCHLGSLENYLKKNRNKFDTTGTGKCSTSSAPGLSVPADNNDKNNTASDVASLNGNKINTLDLLKWSREVSNAMIYLTEKKVIHGDLAARNVLLTEQRVAKISDFGLSRQFLNYANYMKTSKVPVPWRWLAVESLKEMKFSTASDVWAFGVTLWEIFSLSEIPYGAWTYDLFFADRLIAGDRLGMPKHGNEQIYELMKNCWKVKPTERPSFQNIYNILDEYISHYSDFVSINAKSENDSNTTRTSLSVIQIKR